MEFYNMGCKIAQAANQEVKVGNKISLVPHQNKCFFRVEKSDDLPALRYQWAAQYCEDLNLYQNDAVWMGIKNTLRNKE